MGTTSDRPSTPTTVSSQMNLDPHHGMSEYPALPTDPNGRSTAPAPKQDKNADLQPSGLNLDTVEQHGNMTVVKDSGPALPLHGGTPMGQGATTSSVAEQTARRLQNDLDLREAIEADGQTVEDFDISRGIHSGRGVNEPGEKTVDDLRADLFREAGSSEEDVRWDRIHRGK